MELYNAGDNVVELGGWVLTDDLDDPEASGDLDADGPDGDWTAGCFPTFGNEIES